MDKRRWAIVGMWAAAIGAMGAIYVTFEPEREDGRTRGAGGAPTFVAGESPAPAAVRVGLEVAEEEGAPGAYRGGRRHTGRSPFRGPARPVRAWRYRAGGRVSAQPVVADDGTIFVGAHDHRMHAITADGQARWTADLGHRIWSAAGLLDGAVAVGSDVDSFFLLDATDGSTRWRIRAAGDADGAPSLGADGTLYFTAGPHLYAVEPDGEVRWRFQARGPFLLTSPAIDSDGTVYAASIDDHVYAVAADGRMRWEYDAGRDVSSSPVIGDDGTIYFGSDDQSVHALTRDGARRWRAFVDGYVRAPVALGRSGDVIAGVYGPRPRVVSLNAATGRERWFFPITVTENAEVGIASGALVDVDGNVYFGAHDDFLYSLSPEGRLRWYHHVGGDIDSSPILTREGTLVFGSDDGYVYAIRERRPGDAPAAPDGAPGVDAGGGPVDPVPASPSPAPSSPAPSSPAPSSPAG